MTSASSGSATGIDRDWRELSESLAASLTQIPPTYQQALRIMRRQSTRLGAGGRPPRADPLLQVHADVIEGVFRSLLADRRASGVYGVMLRHARRAWRGGADVTARTILRQVTPRANTAGAAPARRRLALLHAVLAFQGGQHASALATLTSIQAALHEMPRPDLPVLVLVHHLIGICHVRVVQPRRALAHLGFALRTARRCGDEVAVAHVLVDLGLAQAAAEPESLPATLDGLRIALGAEPGSLAAPNSRALLRERLCAWAGTADFGLITFLGNVGFKGMGSAAAWDADSFPDLHAADGAGPAIESICGMFTLFDHYVDLTGLSSALGPADDVRELGLPEHPLVAGREELLRAFDADSMLRMIVPLMLQAPRRPPVVQVALCAGPMMCMVLRMIGYHELAYYLNLCLDTVARLRGPSSLPRAELALQRGFFLLADRQDAAARICFAFARRQVLAEGVPWRGELAQAMLGLALVDHRAGKVQAARIRLWRAYLMSLVVSESVAHTWRCANALSAVVARAAAPTAAAARQGRLASLLIDKLSVGQMLAHVGRHSATSVGKNGQWFPALRQAIATLVGLGRLAEAEMVRDMARSAQADRLSRRPRQVDERDFPSLLSGPERRAWQASGLQEMDAQVERLRSLVAGQRLVSAANGRHTSVGTTAELAALWRSLPLAMDASLARAAALLDDGDQESASATVSAMPPAHVNPGCALLGYLVLPDEFVVSLVLPGGTRFEHRVPVGEKELWGLVFRLRSACADAQAPLEHVQSEASRAYALLLGPLRDALEAAGTRQVDVAPHEFLDQVPFAALWDGRQFMVERFAWCVRHPGASPTGDRANAPLGRMRRLQLLGAQDFGHAAAPLGGVRRELARIRADAGPEARVWMDRDMTAAALVTALSDAETDGVHIATHAKFDPIDETRSVLLMGSGETVGIQEIRLRIVDRPVQLLVLAACSTAIKAPARDSIASAFLRAGVRAVLAAQWPVDDASAAWLMPLFYRALRRGEGLPPAQALQAAQLMFMHGDLAGEQWGDEAVDENQPTALDRRHPRLWSPYTLFV